MVGSCFFTQCGNIYLFIGVFRPFTLNVIVNKVKFKSVILLFIFYLAGLCFVSFSSFSAFLELFYGSIIAPFLESFQWWL